MKEIEKILEEKAIRITPMRQLLLKHLLQTDGAFGLQELEMAFPKADRITMYRTLKTFEEKGIIHSIDNGTSEVKYALCKEHCTPSHHIEQHPHFQCQKCKQVSCVDSLLIPEMKLPQGYIQKEVTMMIKGICPNCQG